MNSQRSDNVKTRYRSTLSAVHMVYRLVNSTYNVKELSLRLTRLLCQFIKAQSASVYLVDPNKRRVGLIAMFNNKINITIDKKSELAKVTAKEKRAVEGYVIVEKRLMALPLVADDIVGAILVRRGPKEPPFNEYDKEMLTVFAEQSVTAIKNLQLYEQQQQTILSAIQFIDKLLGKQNHWPASHTPVYFNIVKTIAQRLNMNQSGVESLYYASVLHDTGALDIPYEILAKTSQLTADEFKVIRDLPARSVELIRPVEFLKPVLPIILYHHEKYDGTGYPSGLKGEQIPLGARIMALVDAFEAMTRGRPYKDKLSVPEAIQELKDNSGTQFDPQVVDAFCTLCKLKKFRNYLNAIQ